MRSNILKKIIASSLFISSVFVVGGGVFNQPIIVQADDDIKIFKGNISIEGTTNYLGRNGVTISIPRGIRVKDVDIDNEPHDHIDEAIVGNKIVIYGLRNGVTYRNLVLTLEDFSDVEYQYNINPFTVQGNGVPQGAINNGNNVPQGGFVSSNAAGVSEYLKNVYRNVFGREIDGQGLNYWSIKLSTGAIELEDFFKNLLSENEFMQVAPTVEMKIRKLYAGIFQREADHGGLIFWMSKYQQELREEGNEREALRDVIDDMTDGPEFKQLLIKLGLNFD